MNTVYYPQLDETLCTTRLENGLTVAVVPRRGFTRKLAYFVTDFGAIHTSFSFGGREHQVPGGVAHYLEQKLFDMPDGTDVSEEFAKRGAITNAFTSYDMTAYYFSCTENFSECLELLLKFVCTPWFTRESVEKEQGIIDQEIGMNQDAPDSVVFEQLMEGMFFRHPIRVPILGTAESIRCITPQILELCHRAFYAPGNMLLCVIGDVEPEAVADTARRILGDAPRETGQKRLEPETDMHCPAALVRRSMEVAMPMFNLAFKCEPLEKGERAIREEMIGDLAAEALFGESSALYLRLYEQGLIDSSFGGGFETIDGCAMLLCSGDSSSAEAIREALLEEAARLCREGLEEEAFLRMKRSALGRRIRGLDSFDSTCFRVCAYHFSGFDYFRFPELFETITPGDIQAFLGRVVTRERCCLSIITPISKEAVS